MCEIAQEGFGVAARARRDPRGEIHLELRACALVLTTPIPTFSTCLTSGPVTASASIVLQIPKMPASRFSGAVPFGAAAVVGLSDGRAVVVAPAVAASEDHVVRGWTRHDAEARDAERWHVVVRPEGAESDVDAAARSFVGDLRAETYDSREAGDAQAVGTRLHRPASARVVPGPIADRRRVDVVVTLARPLESQDFEVPLLGVGDAVPRMARATRSISSLRFVLRAREEQAREIVADLGAGPERWQVSVTR